MHRRSAPTVTQSTIGVCSGDGVLRSGVAAPSLAPAPAVTIVLAHGFTNSLAREPFLRLVGWLRRFGDVRALDFRGHGSSAGGSAVGGDPQVRDVDAAVRIGRWALDVIGDTAGRGSAAVPTASATIPA